MQEEIEITIPIAPVTKKNSMQILVNRATGRAFIAPSQKYKNYSKECRLYVHRHNPPIDIPCNVKCLYYMPTHRRVDLTNLLSATMDILVEHGVLADDNSNIVAGHDGSRVQYDKEAPRTEITISPMEGEINE